MELPAWVYFELPHHLRMKRLMRLLEVSGLRLMACITERKLVHMGYITQVRWRYALCAVHKES